MNIFLFSKHSGSINNYTAVSTGNEQKVSNRTNIHHVKSHQLYILQMLFPIAVKYKASVTETMLQLSQVLELE